MKRTIPLPDSSRERLFIGRSRPSRLIRPAVGFEQSVPSQEGIKMPPRRLAIDFGTSAISVAVVEANFEPVVLVFPNGQNRHPFLEEPLALDLGLAHSNLVDNYRLGSEIYAKSLQWSLYPCLKRRIELLARTKPTADWQDGAALDVAAVTMMVLELGRHQDHIGQPITQIWKGEMPKWVVFLSVPNTFPEAGVEVLRHGVAHGVAATLGLRYLPEVETILEAEAVAYFCAPESADPLRLLVLDVGAGTTDASIVHWNDGRARVVANSGLPVGGLDLNALLASLFGPLHETEPIQLLQHLQRADDVKRGFWSDLPDSDPPPPPHENTLEFRTRGLVERTKGADQALKEQDYDGTIRELIAGYHRFLGLAVNAVLGCLPPEELGSLDLVVLSGRGSLLFGFQHAVVSFLKRLNRGKEFPKEKSLNSEDRKLAVVKGLAAYARNAGLGSGRRPMRAGHELVLQTLNREVPLVSFGTALLQGRAFVAWEQRDLENLYRGLVRLIPMDLLKKLPGFTDNVKKQENLNAWACRQIFEIGPGGRPFRCIAYDFLSFKVIEFIDGKSLILETERADPPAQPHHPVHQAQENWFEAFLKGRI